MKKIFTAILILALTVFGLAIGASAAEEPTRTTYLDLPSQTTDGNA